MNKEKSNLLTPSELLTYILVGIIIGIGIFSLAKCSQEKSKQDVWISAAIGAIYPLYLVLISYICKEKPKDNILLLLSRQYFGKLLGKTYLILCL